jgi:hypothetical protein
MVAESSPTSEPSSVASLTPPTSVDPIAATLPVYSAEVLRVIAADDLIEFMVIDEDRVPRNVIDECVSRGDAMLDQLEGILDTGMSWSDDTVEGYWWLTLHMIHILGHIPGQRAGEMLTSAMIRLWEDDEEHALIDWVSGCWPALFRNKPDAVLEPMHEMIADRRLSSYLRSDLLAVVTAAAKRTGAAALEAQLDVAARFATDAHENDVFRGLATLLLRRFPRERHRFLLEEHARSPMCMFTLNEVRAAFELKRDQPEWDRYTNPWVFYEHEQIISRQKRWAEQALLRTQSDETISIRNLADLTDLIDDAEAGLELETRQANYRRPERPPG